MDMEEKEQTCSSQDDWRDLYKYNENYLVYWTWEYNLGDIFSNLVFDFIYDKNKLDMVPDRKKLLLIGSLIPNSCTPDVLICGAGVHVENDEPLIISRDMCTADNFRYVRGKITRRRLVEVVPGIDDNLALGDTGLLASLAYTPPKEKNCDIGIVTHWTMNKREKVDELVEIAKNRFPDLSVDALNMGDRSLGVQDMLDFISTKRTILSSSLHGLVFAHAFGIDALCFHNWVVKYADYYSIYDRIEYADLSEFCTIKKALEHIGDNDFLKSVNPTKEEVERVQKNIILSLPYQECFSEHGEKLLKWAKSGESIQ